MTTHLTMDHRIKSLRFALFAYLAAFILGAGGFLPLLVIHPPVFAEDSPPEPPDSAVSDESSDEIDPEVNFENFLTKSEFEEKIQTLSWKKGDFTFTPYGFFWVNMAVNSGACVAESFCLYNFSSDVNDVGVTAFDARTSRVGMTLDGPGFAGNSAIKTRGVIEVDFQGAVNMTRNKGQVQFRRGFVELINPENETKLQIGQDWDVISPLAPQMLNYLPAGFAGNIGYRRAHMRFDKGHKWSPDFRTLWTLGVADPFPGDFFSTPGVIANGGSWPFVEGRFAVSLWERARCNLPVTVGVSGHIGENSYVFSPIAGSFRTTTETKSIPSWSVNLDADVPLTKQFRLQGEYFLGQNISGFCGAINQGVDLYTREGVRAQGGWMSLHSDLSEKLINNTGYAIDKPFDDDLIGTANPSGGFTNARTQNSVYFTNFLYKWNKALTTGLELSYWQTNYRKANVTAETPVFSSMAPGKNFRTDFAVQYLF